MSKTTTGPWEYVKRPRMGAADGCDIRTVAITQHTPVWRGPTYIAAAYTEANARLITAAPELLKTLREATDRYEVTQDVLFEAGVVGAEYRAVSMEFVNRWRALLAHIDGDAAVTQEHER